MRRLGFLLLTVLLSCVALAPQAEAQITCWQVTVTAPGRCFGTLSACCATPCAFIVQDTCNLVCCLRCINTSICRGNAPL